MNKYSIFFFFVFFFLIAFVKAQKINTREIAEKVLEKGLGEIDLGFYSGSLLLHGMSEFAVLSKSEKVQNQTIEIFKQFKTKEIKGRGNFISYEPGGSGAAYLSWLGVAPELNEQVKEAAQRFLKNQPRSSEGLMIAKTHEKDSLDKVFIDIAFAVTPYLLYSGLKLDNHEYIDFAVFETLELFQILKDKETGLLHQARGWTGKGIISEDNWSRGNGWGAFALAILARDLPESHARYNEVVNLAQKFFKTVLQFQNKNGLWYQEMTDSASYIETSGSGLMLYGLGIMLEKRILQKKYEKNFIKGLRGYLDFIGQDGSVSHTCVGTLHPGRGTKEDYINRRWKLNDTHAFGPVVLAFTQAIKLGIHEIEPLNELGFYVGNTATGKTGTYITHARESNVAWESDRIAFRVFGQEVRGKVKSGIDIWVKSVEYPILDKWYKLKGEGKKYHTDHGEGGDFYNIGLNFTGPVLLNPYKGEVKAIPKGALAKENNKVTFNGIPAWDSPFIILEKRLIKIETFL